MSNTQHIQYPVGQGGLHLGIIGEYAYIYDCGGCGGISKSQWKNIFADIEFNEKCTVLEDVEILTKIMQSNITVSDIKAYLKERLASFKTPKHIFIVDELPLTATGKVLKRELKAKVLNGEFKVE